MWEELENALAWYAAAPQRWVQSAGQDLSAAAEWLWVVLQGDFAEEQSTAQVVTGTVISMIPLVDQLCDMRDVVANCRKIDQDSSDKWAWLALALVVYRRRIRDIFVLAEGVLSVIVVTACFLGKHMLRHGDAGSFLFIGLVVIALSAIGGWWLRTISPEESA